MKTEYRVYKEAFVTEENEILDAVLKGTFHNMDEAHKLVNRLIKEDKEEFAHEYYYTCKYDYKLFANNTAKDWFFDESFGKLFGNPKTAAGILKSK